jgi:ATP-dependent helicase HrpB
LDAGLAGDERILVLQPRRVAARATAARMSWERGTRLGEDVGYRVRMESQVSARTRIEVITEGILLRRLLDDPFLDGVAIVIFDEFHERSLASDLALGMLQQVRQVRNDLKLLVMSATLAAEPVAAYLGNAPIVRSDGRLFPVTIHYSPHLDRKPLESLVAEVLPAAMTETSGDCLIFLPGVGEIRKVGGAIQALADEAAWDVVELYGDLPPEKQDAALQPGSRRKVILSTNVAETSLTIEGVTAVIDSGLARVLRFDEAIGLDRLELGPISQASADQRAGRAGRVRAGACWRLWPEAMQRQRPEFETAEIRRVDLSSAALQVLAWIEPALEQFPWFEPPSPPSLARAIDLLRRLEAVTLDSHAITPLGRALVELPVHPRLARLLLAGAERGVTAEAALAAALLSERDPFAAERSAGPRGPRPAAIHADSDLLERVRAMEEFSRTGRESFPIGTISRGAARQVLRSREQLQRLVARGSLPQSHVIGTLRVPSESSHSSHGTRSVPTTMGPDERLLQAIAAAFPDRIARRREPHSARGVLVGGRGVRLAEESVVREAELFACLDLDAGEAEARVRQASLVRREWLPQSLVKTEIVVTYDESAQKIIARRQTRYDTLVLDEQPTSLPDSAAAAEALAAAARQHWDQAFPHDRDEVTSYIARVRCLAQWMPDLQLPELSDEILQSLLPELCRGRRSFAELRTAPWLDAIQNLLTYPQRRAVETEAPERCAVPSGSRIAIQYAPGQPPVLAVRIQEVFGLAATPRIAGGRGPGQLLAERLSPGAERPARQISQARLARGSAASHAPATAATKVVVFLRQVIRRAGSRLPSWNCRLLFHPKEAALSTDEGTESCGKRGICRENGRSDIRSSDSTV